MVVQHVSFVIQFATWLSPKGRHSSDLRVFVTSWLWCFAIFCRWKDGREGAAFFVSNFASNLSRATKLINT